MNTEPLITTDQDEREGKASASRMARIIGCPGSFQLEPLFPKQEENEYAVTGTKIHEAIEKDNFAKLSSEEFATATRIQEQTGYLMGQVFWSDLETAETRLEQRLWNTARTYSGKPDLIALNNERVLVLDYKTGRGEYPIAKNNWQLKTLAVLVMLNYPARSEYHAAIIQPNIGAPTLAVWTLDDVKGFLQTITSALATAKEARAIEQTSPGQHCKYCRALGHCKSTRNELATIAALPALEAIDAEDLAKLLDAADRAETVIENIKKEARTRLAAQKEVPGWTLGAGRSRKVIMDNAAAAEALQHIVPTPEFLQCCTVKLGELEDAVQKAEGFSAAETKAVMETYLKGIVMTTHDRPSLRRSKLAIAG